MTKSPDPSASKPRIVAPLPMKAHSARVSGKNFRDFCGKPLFRWMLDTLLSVEDIDQIVINTDARDILASHGLVDSDRIRIRDRKPEIRGDFVSMNLVLADDVAQVPADIDLMTHTTNPLMKAETVRGALEAFRAAQTESRADSLFSVDKIQTRFYRADCSPVNHDPDNLIRTQDLEPWFEENSNLYLFTRDSFAKTQARIGKQPMMYESAQFESIDIDTPADWDFAIVAARHLLEQTA
ncbi:pseudaminic acid CMP-transferase [Thiorhodovibrio winogradskyi]|uniref:Pseudaminic acid CMP-transferase n=1 Tax=Thiorhodovibrio winogradskyi TaxID=77007 RepID=A0ABZ0S4J2_9GAMM|nr:acylneuraminate cytidylyltransferase family protein [Thiorhodovibrio winogradskyi]